MSETATRARATPARRRLFRHPGRVAVVAIIVLVVLNLGVFLLNQSDTSTTGSDPLPADIESIGPERGELVGPIATVSVDLADQYSGVLVVDGVEIPEDQLERVLSLQTISFRPGRDKVFSRFRAGENAVVVRYWRGRLQDRPADPFSFGWTFRASA
jgi:hypothetical protein